jgi:hypothetical protein
MPRHDRLYEPCELPISRVVVVIAFTPHSFDRVIGYARCRLKSSPGFKQSQRQKSRNGRALNSE